MSTSRLRRSCFRSLLAAAALSLACLVLLPACGAGREAREGHADAHGAPTGHGGAGVVITGTTVDAATGTILAGVRVEGPGGQATVSDAGGRFVLDGLAVGEAGYIVGRSEDGLEARNTLRPLQPEGLEVVLRLRNP